MWSFQKRTQLQNKNKMINFKVKVASNSHWCRYCASGLWIQIQYLCGSGSVLGIRIPDPGTRKLRIFSWKMAFFVIFKEILPLKRYKIAPTTGTFRNFFFINNTGIYLIWLKYWFPTNLRKKSLFKSCVLAWIQIRIRNLIRIRIELKCWIRIESIRIHNPAVHQYFYIEILKL
jgi:hypothetical protein